MGVLEGAQVEIIGLTIRDGQARLFIPFGCFDISIFLLTEGWEGIVMENSRKRTWKLLLAAAALAAAALACSVDLGLDSKPDETELARNVEMTLTAILATEVNVVTQTEATTPSDTPEPPPPTPTNSEPPTETSIPPKPPTPTKEGVYIGPIKFASKVDENNEPVEPSACA